MKKNSKFLLFFLLSLFSFNLKAESKKIWVYFDLGNTIVNTKDLKHLTYMKDAREYMEELKREGFKIGIISNIPEDWGMDYDEKFLSLKKFINDGWSEERPFDWGLFDEVILPLKNSEMKPAATLFLKAINKAESCPSAYIGESPKEIEAAAGVGMAAKLFVETDKEKYIPVMQMRTFISNNYNLEYDKECF